MCGREISAQEIMHSCHIYSCSSLQKYASKLKINDHEKINCEMVKTEGWWYKKVYTNGLQP